MPPSSKDNTRTTTMAKCTKVKNPCKICLAPVKQKTGLQCQGACESWVHYTCLNYTPGKIKDIQNGVITVTCPCPDCKTTVPKEILRDPPFSCNNVMCPANNPPSCDEASCQANEITASRPPPVPPPGTLIDCGDECVNYLQSVFNSKPDDPCMQGFSVSATNSETTTAGKGDKKKGYHSPYAPVPCCGGAGGGGGGCTGGGGGGGSGGGAVMPSISTVQHMCQTVGELTNQINELMMQMRQTGMAGEGRNSRSSDRQKCTQSGPKEMCPKPCYCPGNPVRRQ